MKKYYKRPETEIDPIVLEFNILGSSGGGGGDDSGSGISGTIGDGSFGGEGGEGGPGIIPDANKQIIWDKDDWDIL